MVDKNGAGSTYFKKNGQEEPSSPEEGILHQHQHSKPEVSRVDGMVAEDGGGVQAKCRRIVGGVQERADFLMRLLVEASC